MKIRSKLIAVMFIIYFIVFIVDMRFTLQNMEQEGNPISVYFISLMGFPLNLLVPFVYICLLLRSKKMWNKIDTNFKVFFLFYIVILIFTIGHFRGIVSWL